MDIWPLGLLIPTAQLWTVEGSPAQGGTPLSGPGQTADLSCGGWWTCSLDLTLRTQDHHRAYRSALVALKTTSPKMVFPVLDGITPFPFPWAATGGGGSVPDPTVTTFAETLLSSGAIISAALAANAYAPTYPAPPAAPTVAQITGAVMGQLQGGERYTVVGPSGMPRMHEIGRISAQTGMAYTLTSYPPFRENYATGSAVYFDRPCCTMKLAPESWSNSAPEYRGGNVSRVQLKLVEAFADPA